MATLRLHVKAPGRNAVVVEVDAAVTTLQLRERAGEALGLPAAQTKLVWRSQTLEDDAPRVQLADGDTVLAFKRPQAAVDSAKWELHEEEDDAETQLRALREKAARAFHGGGLKGRVSRLLRHSFLPDELVGAVLSIKLWQWAVFAAWLVGSRISYHAEWGPVYIILTGFVVIFTNLGTRKAGEASAYSVFNEGFRELPGTFNANRVDEHLRRGNM